jgi:1-acyl-sn-glycerol-3-phosphate acyltransferase
VGFIKGITALVALAASTVVLTLLIGVFALLKFLAPGGAARDRVRRLLASIAEAWISLNSFALGLYRGTYWDVEIPQGLDRRGCYLVNCNHQSWVDIPVLQRCFNRRLPFLRFFLKSQLIWVPFLGPAWWALDFPFMKRVSREKLAKRPGLRGKDLESARKACEKFRSIPVAMMNFPEGTRFTAAKRAASKSPYRNLLTPRIGGIGQVLYALADDLDGMVDVTIVYTSASDVDAAPNLWKLVSGQIPRITVRAVVRDIPAHLRGRNFRADRAYRRELQSWIDGVWREKDATIDAIRSTP